MFEGTMIVKSAASAFNNAALVAPAFLWVALLALPLFALVYFCGNAVMEKVGWNSRNIMARTALWTVVLSLIWVVLFGGNYGVLRDNATILPFVIATIVFVSSVFVGSYHNSLNLPKFHGASRGTKIGIICAWIFGLAIIGLSDLHAWWGPLLQIGAFLFGLGVGRLARAEMRPIAGAVLVMAAITVAVLMQPEFFRFGQLGALTPVHQVFLILMAMALAAVVALRNIKPRGIIRHSAYVKLKWLARFISVLCMALFVLTESVPVYLGMMLMFFITFAMSVAHAAQLPERADERVFAITLGMFGTITMMPAVTALGILYWIVLPRTKAWQSIGFLL